MNRIKWTQSLDNAVRACRRKPFLMERYANPLSKDGTARREAFLHKQAIDVALWRGNLVHKTIEKCLLPALRKGEELNFEFAHNWLLRLVDRQAEFSRTAKYRQFSKEKAGDVYCVLRGDLIGNPITADDLETVRQTSLAALHNLETRFEDLLERVRYAKTLEIEKEIRFSLDDRIRIEAIVDLILVESDGRIVIVDWKAGLNVSANAREQLFVYAYAVINSGYWGTPECQNIELIEASLMTGNKYVYPLTKDDLFDADDRIFSGAQLLEAIFEESGKTARPKNLLRRNRRELMNGVL